MRDREFYRKLYKLQDNDDDWHTVVIQEAKQKREQVHVTTKLKAEYLRSVFKQDGAAPLPPKGAWQLTLADP